MGYSTLKLLKYLDGGIANDLIVSVSLDTVYFAENTVTKYFLLLQIIIHPFFSLGWSMNSAMDQGEKKKKRKGNRRSTQTDP